jgi:hypothetical protein
LSFNKNAIDDEIDVVRLNLYEQTRNMSYKEFKYFIKKRIRAI